MSSGDRTTEELGGIAARTPSSSQECGLSVPDTTGVAEILDAWEWRRAREEAEGWRVVKGALG